MPVTKERTRKVVKTNASSLGTTVRSDFFTKVASALDPTIGWFTNRMQRFQIWVRNKHRKRKGLPLIKMPTEELDLEEFNDSSANQNVVWAYNEDDFWAADPGKKQLLIPMFDFLGMEFVQRMGLA